MVHKAYLFTSDNYSIRSLPICLYCFNRKEMLLIAWADLEIVGRGWWGMGRNPNGIQDRAPDRGLEGHSPLPESGIILLYTWLKFACKFCTLTFWICEKSVILLYLQTPIINRPCLRGFTTAGTNLKCRWVLALPGKGGKQIKPKRKTFAVNEPYERCVVLQIKK